MMADREGVASSSTMLLAQLLKALSVQRLADRRAEGHQAAELIVEVVWHLSLRLGCASGCGSVFRMAGVS